MDDRYGTTEPGTAQDGGGPGVFKSGEAFRSIQRKLYRALYRVSEQFYEWRYGISTSTVVALREFGVTDSSFHGYGAISYRRFFQLMKRIRIRPGEDVFLDFGSGMGRAVILAACFPLRKVIGVELIPELHGIAQENVRCAKPHLRCEEVELHNVDARNFIIAPDITIIYFWNPFSGEILSTVLDNIQASIKRSPREVTILHLSPDSPTCLDRIRSRFDWLKESQRFNLGKASVAVYTCGSPDA